MKHITKRTLALLMSLMLMVSLFVGVAVPHIAKLLFGSSKPIVIIPGSFLLGAAFCMGCDLIARTILSPTELAISTVTAVFGAPDPAKAVADMRKIEAELA